jgi:RNA polymerase sigma factor FliA
MRPAAGSSDVLRVQTQPKPRRDRRRRADDEALALWRRYRATADPRLRDRLVLTFAPLVKYIAFRKAREIPPSCDIKDLISCGLEALIRSIDRFDPEAGVTFEQFLWMRIHGAVLDELRRLDWAPRSARQWARQVAGARDEFVALHGRRPSPPELAGIVGVDVEELRRREAAAPREVVSLNAPVRGEDQQTVERIETIEATDRDGDPEQAATQQMAYERLHEAVATLPERERQVAELRYVKDMPMREIGHLLGVSEGRISQIHT